ncbi:MAG: SDR family oxidoreductase [Pseudomonadota bacterium]|jgi:citronellol/citronellal dehydrogenase
MNKRYSKADAPPGKFGVSDEALANHPTVFRNDLFKGKRVLVSGAGSGIGKATAYLFARLGADLVICGRNEERLAVAEDWLKKFGAKVETHALSIRDHDAVAKMIDSAFANGGVDIQVNNAGGQFSQKAIDYSVKGWNAVIDTNLNGTWYMMQNLARHLRDAGRPGHIINIVADIWRGMPDAAHTCAARAGVVYLSKTVAVEWAEHQIQVNCVAPGAVETEGFGNYPPEASATFAQANPMLHVGESFDIAEACAYLAAPSGKFITGEVLTVDGGQQLWSDLWLYGKPDYFKQGG